MRKLLILVSLFILPIINILADNNADIKAKVETYFNQGTDLLESGKYEEAIAAFDLAIKYQSDFPEAYYNKGISLTHLGREKEADEAFAIAEKLKK